MRLPPFPAAASRRAVLGAALAACAPRALPSDGRAGAGLDAADVQRLYASAVDRRLDVPAAEADRLARLAQAALDREAVDPATPQYVLVVDRNAWVQAALLFWRSAGGEWRLAGASPVSTGLQEPGAPAATPTGVFRHGAAAVDPRAPDAPGADGLRRYGPPGTRVFDFGWHWPPLGPDGLPRAPLRVLVHATDPQVLEPRLGIAQTGGAVHVPVALAAFLDRHGVLDAADGADARADPSRVKDPGRYLVIVDSGREERPEWSPLPFLAHRRPPLPGR